MELNKLLAVALAAVGLYIAFDKFVVATRRAGLT